MDKTNNNNQSVNNQAENNNPETGVKTFTQEDVNRIVGERLAKEKNKGDAAFLEREQQLAEREKQIANREAMLELQDQLKEMDLPAELLPVLNVQDKDALNKALEALEKYISEKSKAAEEYHVYDPQKLPTGEHKKEASMDVRLRNAMRLPG